MELSHLFEALMLVCFGFSWPLNVVKNYKARTAKGTSLAFILLIIIGYVAGITAKIITAQFNYVLAVYFLNLAIVTVNVFVYIRNKNLDKKAQAEQTTIKFDAAQVQQKAEKLLQEEEKMNISREEYLDLPEQPSEYQEKNGVILIGSELDKKIPVSELATSFDFNFPIYNESAENLSLENVQDYFEKEISTLNPEGVILHIGEKDLNLFTENSNQFDNLYISLLSKIKKQNKKCRIALVSVNNPAHNKIIETMNAHIKAIADSGNFTFVNVENAKLWNPEATKASNDFAYSMGLSVRKPLKNVSEILFSYAYNNLYEGDVKEDLIG